MRKDDGWFLIKDFDTFINATRSLVFNSFGKSHTEPLDDLGIANLTDEERDELDTVLSYAESSLIAKEIMRKQTNKKTAQERYLMSEESYYRFVDALNYRMVGNLLNSLVNKGMIEASFDSEANDFVFWVKDQNDENSKTD